MAGTGKNRDSRSLFPHRHPSSIPVGSTRSSPEVMDEATAGGGSWRATSVEVEFTYEGTQVHACSLNTSPFQLSLWAPCCILALPTGVTA